MMMRIYAMVMMNNNNNHDERVYSKRGCFKIISNF